jgi:hypothetical protein
VIGGYVVRDETLRSLYGRYLYSDFCSGELRSLIARPGRARDEKPTGLALGSTTSLGEAPDGRIFVASYSGGVYRMVPE